MIAENNLSTDELLKITMSVNMYRKQKLELYFTFMQQASNMELSTMHFCFKGNLFNISVLVDCLISLHFQFK